MPAHTTDGPPLVRFGRRQSRGLLLGLSGIRLCAIGVALACATLAMFTAGVTGAAVSALVWAPLLASAFVRWNGRAAIETLPMLAHWGARSASGQTRYRVRAGSPRPYGTLALPGDAAALRAHTDAETGAVMIHDPHRRTLAAVLRVSHPAYVLLSPDDQTHRVSAWGRLLAGLAASGTCAAVQVLESTLPDPGHGVRGWFTTHGVHDDSWAAREYAALMAHAAPSSSTHRSLIVISIDLNRAAKAVRDAGRGITGAAAVLRAQMGTFEASVRAADLRTEGWLSPDQLALVLRQAYDPAADTLQPGEPGTTLATAGPVAVHEQWDHLRHDGAYSSVLWLSEWPRIDVAPHFLHSLVFQQGVRKTISIIAKPLGTAEALRSIRKEKVEYLTDAAQNARIGRIADLSAEQEYHDVLTRERALISGHADMRFCGFIAITAPSRDELASAVAATQRAATQCGCETRILYSEQAQGFAVAALPIGRGLD